MVAPKAAHLVDLTAAPSVDLSDDNLAARSVASSAYQTVDQLAGWTAVLKVGQMERKMVARLEHSKAAQSEPQKERWKAVPLVGH